MCAKDDHAKVDVGISIGQTNGISQTKTNNAMSVREDRMRSRSRIVYGDDRATNKNKGIVQRESDMVDVQFRRGALLHLLAVGCNCRSTRAQLLRVLLADKTTVEAIAFAREGVEERSRRAERSWRPRRVRERRADHRRRVLRQRGRALPIAINVLLEPEAELAARRWRDVDAAVLRVTLATSSSRRVRERR